VWTLSESRRYAYSLATDLAGGFLSPGSTQDPTNVSRPLDTPDNATLGSNTFFSRVVMNASALPDPREVNYDQLLA